MHVGKIKAAVRKQFPDIKIGEVKKFGFGVFSVKITKELPRATKHGIVVGDWNGGDVELDKKIDWI